MKALRRIVILILVAACNNNTQESNNPFTSLPTWSLEQDLLIEESDDLIFGYTYPPEITSDGEILVADFQNSVIHHFNKDGQSLGTFSRKGSGPGEINQMGSGTILEDDTFVIFDRAEMRFTKFRRQHGSWNHTEIIPTATRVSAFSEGPENTIIYHGVTVFDRSNIDNSERGYTLSQMKLSGEILRDSLIYGPVNTHLIRIEGTGFMVRNMPTGYGLNSISQVYNKSLIVHAQTDAFQFTVKNILTDEVKTFSHPIEPVALTSAEKDTLISQVGPQFTSVIRDKMPEYHRIIESFFVSDDGKIWVRLGAKSNPEPEFDWIVVDLDGTLIAKVRNPEGVSISSLKNGKVYGSRRSPETGTSIYRFRINKHI